MRAFSAILLVCLSATPMARSADAPQPGGDELAIDTGRLVVMVDQSEAALKLLVPAVRIEDSGPEPVQTDAAFPKLVYAVGRYNMIAAAACRAGVVEVSVCAGPYNPNWLNDTSRHSNVALRAMIDDAAVRLGSFWTAICGRAKQVAKDEAFCQLE